MLTWKEYVELLRFRKASEFGKVERKTDCQHCGENGCVILNTMCCESGICHWYTKKVDD